MPEKPARSTRGWLVAIGAVMLLLALSAAALAWWIPRFIRQQIVAQAAQRGVVLTFEDYDLEVLSYDERRFSLRLSGVQAEFDKLPRTSASIERLELTAQTPSLSKVNINAMELDGVSVRTRGKPEKVIEQLLRWSKDAGLAVPAQAKRLAVSWEVEGATGTPPTLVELSDAALLFVPDASAELQVPELKGLGQVFSDSVISSKTTLTTLTTHLQAGEAGVIPISIEVEDPNAKPRWQIQTEVADLAKLARHFGLASITQAVKLDGVGLRLDANLNKKGLGWEGRAEATLSGFTPPHPIELSGFDFGKSTKLAVKYHARHLLEQIELSKVGVQAGVFRLSGTGQLERQPLGADLHLDLSGQLPCNEVAASAARARDNSVFGRFFSKVARQVLNGSVGFRILVDADVPLMLRSNVQRGIGLGCGLRPLREIELKPILDAVPELGAGLPTLSEALDKLPKPQLPGTLPKPGTPLTLPSLKDLPGLLPNFEIDVKRSKESAPPEREIKEPESREPE